MERKNNGVFGWYILWRGRYKNKGIYICVGEYMSKKEEKIEKELEKMKKEEENFTENILKNHILIGGAGL